MAEAGEVQLTVDTSKVEKLCAPKFWMQDFTEELCILIIGVIALVSIWILKKDSVPIVTGLGGGLVGYLTKGIKQKITGE